MLTERLGWDDVLNIWQENENGRWEDVFISRGFSDWWSWRQTYISDLGLPYREWHREIIADPLKEVSRWFVGGYRGWKQYIPETELRIPLPTFGDIVRHPVLLMNGRVQQLIQEGIRSTTFIVLRCGSEIAVMDGSHRAAAVALMAFQCLSLDPEVQITVLIGTIPESERSVFDTFRKSRPAVRADGSAI